MNEDTKLIRADAPVRVSRRSLLGSMAAAAVAPVLMSQAWAQTDLAQTNLANPDAARKQAGVIIDACAPVPRFQHTSASLGGGRLLVVGGWRHSNLPSYVPPLADAQIYDSAAHIWTQAASLKTARAQHAAVTLSDGRVLVVGGMNHAPMANAEIYDPATDAWTTVAPMTQALCGHAAACAGGLVIVSGGLLHGPLASVQIYDVAADTWRLAR